MLEFRTKKLLSLICLVIVTKIKVHRFHRQFHKILETQYFGLRELGQTKNELTHEKHQRTAAEQRANNLGDQLKSAKENYAHSQAELAQVKAEKDGVFAALARNKRELHRKEQQINQVKVELTGEKYVRAATEQKAERLDDQLKRAQENSALCQTELAEVRLEYDGIATALKICEEKLRNTERQLDDMKEELHQLRECRKSWEPHLTQLLKDEGVSISAAIYLLNHRRKYPVCIQVMSQDSYRSLVRSRAMGLTLAQSDSQGTRSCHILFDDETRVKNEITQLAFQMHKSLTESHFHSIYVFKPRSVSIVQIIVTYTISRTIR